MADDGGQQVLSPYHAMACNPVTTVDPLGLIGIPLMANSFLDAMMVSPSIMPGMPTSNFSQWEGEAYAYQAELRIRWAEEQEMRNGIFNGGNAEAAFATMLNFYVRDVLNAFNSIAFTGNIKNFMLQRGSDGSKITQTGTGLSIEGDDYSATMTEGGPDYRAFGVKVDINYKGDVKKYSKLNWIQTANTNRLSNKDDKANTWFNDFSTEFGNKGPFYYADHPIISQGLQQRNKDKGGIVFSDNPNSYGIPSRFDAYVSLMGYDAKAKVWNRVATFSYGFDFNKNQEVTYRPVTMLPSSSGYWQHMFNVLKANFVR